MNTPLISVAVCTHNRSDDVAECINTLMPQLDERFEVILVDSASAPEHAAKVAKLASAHPTIRFTRVDQPGVALARNTMLSMVRSPWMASLDDDAVPASDWAEVALDLESHIGPEYGIVGGAVHPLVPPGAERPLGRRWMQLLSAVELKGEFDQTEHPAVVGANMWFRADALRSINGFPENLGRVGASLLSGEDKLPTHRLIDAGWRIWYCERLQVGHKIHRERLTRRWACKRARWDGITDKRIERMMHKHSSRIEIFKMALKTAALAALYVVPSLDQEYFLRFWYDFGWLMESLHPPGPEA